MKMKHLIMTGAILLSSGAMAGLSSVVSADADNTMTTKGVVEFEEDTAPTDPRDPMDPDKPIDPTERPTPTHGPLSIDYASSFDFDINKISSQDRIYYSLMTEINQVGFAPNWVQVTDKRGTNAGWKLTVTQADEFKTANGDELKGAQVTLKNTTVKTTSDNKASKPTTSREITLVKEQAQDVMIATENQGMGTWLDVFGDETTGDKSIELMVPGTSAKVKDVAYSTDIVWTLSDTPA